MDAHNSGDWNGGNSNSGICNSGDWNGGNRNSGDWNSGDWNSGDWNSGNRNSGDWNSGDWNSGNRNSGNRNSGDWNSGICNSGDWNSGWFNSDEPNARFFNRDTDIKLSNFLNSEDCPSWIGFKPTEWVDISNMTEDEKAAHPTHETCGGYLRKYCYKEAWAKFWKETSEENRHKFLNLPNFDAAIFFDITGIDIRKTALSGKEVSVTAALKRVKKALRG